MSFQRNKLFFYIYIYIYLRNKARKKIQYDHKYKKETNYYASADNHGTTSVNRRKLGIKPCTHM